jgi:hypothetical protein
VLVVLLAAAERKSMNAMAPCPPDSDLMKAWNAYQETEDFKNSKHWAMVIAPFVQVGSEAEKTRMYEIMSLEQRERHVQGSLWACFVAGYKSRREV